MAVLKPARRGSVIGARELKQLHEQQQTKAEILQKTRLRPGRAYHDKSRCKSTFPFLQLPLEIRLQIYRYLFYASSKKVRKRALPTLRASASNSLQAGVIAIRNIGYEAKDASLSASGLHSRSAKPSMAIQQTSCQIYYESRNEVYTVNAFEVVARIKRPGKEPIFEFPGSLELGAVRELILVTDTEVSIFEGCNTYEIFTQLKCLRKLSVAMKTPYSDGGPCFNSCLEALNLLIWVPKSVEVVFCALQDLKHHDHPTWIDPRILDHYFTLFNELRGMGYVTWTVTVAMAYDKALQIAKCFGTASRF